MLVTASVLGCQAKSPLQSSQASAEALRLSSALYAMRMTPAELGGHGSALSQEQREAAFLESAALLLIDSSKTPPPANAAGPGAGSPSDTPFDSYFLVAREAVFGSVKEQPLPKSVAVALLYGTSWPPCFGSAKCRATLEGSTDDKSHTDALVVEDCLRPGSIYAGVALIGAASQNVRVLVDADALSRANIPPYDLANMNALLRRAGKKRQFTTDRRYISRDDPTLRAAREAAEALPELHGAHAEYVVEQGALHWFIFELPNATGGPGKLALVEVGADHGAAVKDAELR
jgi:hypothetical protein